MPPAGAQGTADGGGKGDLAQWLQDLEQTTRRTVHRMNASRRRDAQRRDPSDLFVHSMSAAQLDEQRAALTRPRSSDAGEAIPAPGTRSVEQ